MNLTWKDLILELIYEEEAQAKIKCLESELTRDFTGVPGLQISHLVLNDDNGNVFFVRARELDTFSNTYETLQEHTLMMSELQNAYPEILNEYIENKGD